LADRTEPPAEEICSEFRPSSLISPTAANASLRVFLADAIASLQAVHTVALALLQVFRVTNLVPLHLPVISDRIA